MVEDVGENAHVEYCVSHGVADGVLARDDADGVECHALERRAVGVSKTWGRWLARLDLLGLADA